MLAGEITFGIQNTNPASPESRQPPGTITQMVSYFEKGEEVVRLHQFVLPDGSLGGSGLPDPKTIYEGPIAYLQRRKARNWREKLCYFISDTTDRICWKLGIEVD